MMAEEATRDGSGALFVQAVVGDVCVRSEMQVDVLYKLSECFSVAWSTRAVC